MLGATIAELRAEGLLPGERRRRPPGRLTRRSRSRRRCCRSSGSAPRGPRRRHVLGPEMRSTGEVMGIDASFGTAFAKSQLAAYGGLPTKGTVFVSVANRDKRAMIFPVKRLADLGFEILATEGTAEVLRRNGVEATRRAQAQRRPRPGGRADRRRADPGRRGRPGRQHAVGSGRARRRLRDPRGRDLRWTDRSSRPCRGSAAAVQGIEALGRGELGVRSLQEYGAGPARPRRAATPASGRGVTDGRAARAGARRGALHPTGRRLPPPDARGAGHRRHAPGPATSWPWPSAAPTPGWCCAGRSRSTGSAAAASTAAPSRSSSRCAARAPRGWPRLPPHEPVDVVGPLGAVRAAQGAGERDPGRRRLRHRAAVRASPRSCAPAAAGSTSCSAPRTEDRLFGALEAKRMASHGGHHDRGRLRWACAAGSPTCCPR